MKKYSYTLKGLDCANCARKIEVELSDNNNFKNVVVNFNTLKLGLETDLIEPKELLEKIIKSIEPEVELLDNNVESNSTKNSSLFPVLRLIIGILIGILGLTIKMPFKINEILVVIAYLILLYRTMKNSISILKKSKSIDENFLVTISCIGAYLVGEHMEGLMVIILFEIGKILEEKAINNTRKSIKELMNIKPEYANLKKDKSIIEVKPDDLKEGDIIVVKKGEKIPTDGIIIKGNTKLDTSALTGESDLQIKSENDEVLSGSINIEEVIEVKVTCEYSNSTVSKILELVENATDKKAKTETFVNKAAKIYTPIVLGLAILVAIILPLVTNLSYQESIYRGLIFLVIACPCAIAISVPLSYFSGIGVASKHGILIKGSDYLDAIKDIKTIVFDKTGTITKGSFRVKEVREYALDKEELIMLAVKGESFSNHPIAKAIVKLKNYVDTSDIKDYKEISGKGIEYKINDDVIRIGNKELINNDIECNETIIFISKNNILVGSIIIDDGIKDNAKEVIEELRKQNIKTAMFTGDNKNTAKVVADTIKLDVVEAELLPEDKYKKLEELINTEKEGKVAFVGDGINDAPVLARSDIGYSMGSIGSESAIEASDVVLMTDSLESIIKSINISKKTNRIIKQNLVFAIGTKVLILSLSVFGLAGMWQAIFADVGVTLITILNTSRILRK